MDRPQALCARGRVRVASPHESSCARRAVQCTQWRHRSWSSTVVEYEYSSVHLSWLSGPAWGTPARAPVRGRSPRPSPPTPSPTPSPPAAASPPTDGAPAPTAAAPAPAAPAAAATARHGAGLREGARIVSRSTRKRRLSRTVHTWARRGRGEGVRWVSQVTGHRSQTAQPTPPSPAPAQPSPRPIQTHLALADSQELGRGRARGVRRSQTARSSTS